MTSEQMAAGLIRSPQDPIIRKGDAPSYSCPVCGIGLARSDFDTSKWDYYCPFCATRQTPSVVRFR